MQTKSKKRTDSKRHGSHHRHSKPYKQVYWPYLPLVVVSLFIMVVSFIPRRSESRTLAYATEMSHQTLLQATNAQRRSNGKELLELNQQLNAAAQAKANDMAARDYWAHKTPEGQDPWVFIDKTGYEYHKAGENLAYGFMDSTTTVRGWMNSLSHRENLLDSAFTEVGFGFANAPDFQGKGPETIIVALYGRPQSLGAHVASPAEPADTTPVAAQPVKAVTKAETIFGSSVAWAPFAIGLVSGGAVTGLFVNHGLRLRKLLKKGENYFVAHPLLDVSLVFLAIAAVELSTTVGYIH